MDNQHIGAQSKKPRDDGRTDPPMQQPMRQGDKIRRAPSTDQLKARRQMARSASLRTAASGDTADCPYCDAPLTQEADGMFRHLGDNGCSFGNEGFSISEMENAHPGISFGASRRTATSVGDTIEVDGHQRVVQTVKAYADFTDVYLTAHCECHDAPQAQRSIRTGAKARTASENVLESDSVLEEAPDDGDAIVAARKAMFPGSQIGATPQAGGNLTMQTSFGRTADRTPEAVRQRVASTRHIGRELDDYLDFIEANFGTRNMDDISVDLENSIRGALQAGETPSAANTYFGGDQRWYGRFSSKKTAGWTLEDLRGRVDSGDYYAPIGGTKLDNVSAGALLSVLEALNAENQAKLLAMDITKATEIAWKLMNKSGSKTAMIDLPAMGSTFDYGGKPVTVVMRDEDMNWVYVTGIDSDPNVGTRLLWEQIQEGGGTLWGLPMVSASMLTASMDQTDAEVIAWARRWAEAAGGASVTHVSGPDVLRLCDLAGGDSQIVNWCRGNAIQADGASVSRISGPDLAVLCDMAEKNAKTGSRKTAAATLVKVKDLKVGDEIAILSGTTSRLTSITPSGNWGGATYELIVTDSANGEMRYQWPADLDVFIGGIPTSMQMQDAIAALGSRKTGAVKMRYNALVFDVEDVNRTWEIFEDPYDAYILGDDEFLAKSWNGYITICRMTGRTRKFWGIDCPTIEQYEIETYATEEGVIMGRRSSRIAGMLATRPENIVTGSKKTAVLTLEIMPSEAVVGDQIVGIPDKFIESVNYQQTLNDGWSTSIYTVKMSDGSELPWSAGQNSFANGKKRIVRHNPEGERAFRRNASAKTASSPVPIGSKVRLRNGGTYVVKRFLNWSNSIEVQSEDGGGIITVNVANVEPLSAESSRKTATDYDQIDFDANASYWSGAAAASRAQEESARKLRDMKDKEITVVRGRKIPIGTRGTVFYSGEGQWGWRIGFKGEDGQEYWTDLKNVSLTSEMSATSARIASELAAVRSCYASLKTAGTEGDISKRLKNWVLGDPNCSHLNTKPSSNAIMPYECVDCGYGMTSGQAEEARGQMSMFGGREAAFGYSDAYNQGFATGYNDTGEWDESLAVHEDYGTGMNAGYDAARAEREREISDQIQVAVYGPEGPTWQDRHDREMMMLDQLGPAYYSSMNVSASSPKIGYGTGPNGFWCRYCGEYQSIRSAADNTAMRKHMDDHKAAGDEYLPVVNGFPSKASKTAAGDNILWFPDEENREYDIHEGAYDGPNFLSVYGDQDVIFWLVEDRNNSDYVASGGAHSVDEAKSAAAAAHYQAIGGQMSMFASGSEPVTKKQMADYHADLNGNEVEGLPDDETWIENEGNFQVDAVLRQIIKETK